MLATLLLRFLFFIRYSFFIRHTKVKHSYDLFLKVLDSPRSLHSTFVETAWISDAYKVHFFWHRLVSVAAKSPFVRLNKPSLHWRIVGFSWERHLMIRFHGTFSSAMDFPANSSNTDGRDAVCQAIAC